MIKNFKRKIFVCLFLVSLIFCYMLTCVSRVLVEKGCAEFEAQISTACYAAISELLQEKCSFDELFYIKTDVNGQVVFLSTDAMKINFFAKTLADKTYYNYSVLADGGVDIPVGAFTGLKILSGVGKTVKMRLINVKSVRCEFLSDFSAAGINQTKQSLYLKIVPEIYVIAGITKKKIDGEINVLCYENIIVGKVPECYLGSSVISVTAN